MKIYVKPRIHIGLISMHDGGYRKNGGIGFAIEEPKGALEFSASDCFSFRDNRQKSLGESEQHQLLSVLSKTHELLNLDKRIAIEFSGDFLTHAGMGSGSALRLGCLEALLLINGKELEQEILVSLSKRGGASGIGIQTYFSGQLVFDLGVKSGDGKFAPSSQIYTLRKPLLLDAVDFPDWTIGLCIPKSIPSKSQAEEIEFFEKSSPIKPPQSYETLFHSLFGAYASVKDKDIETFSQSIKELQNCEWKRLERSLYDNELFELESRLYEYGAMCVGMSSLGPLLYFLAPEHEYAKIQAKMNKADCTIFLTKASNSGREIVW